MNPVRTARTTGLLGIARPAVLAAVAVATMLAAAACKPSSADTASSAPSGSVAAAATASPVPATTAPTVDPTVDPTPSAAPSTAPTTAAPSPKPTRTASAGPLRMGSSGPAVVHLQQQLTSLGYWVGNADGKFGSVTQQAVFALQKAAKLSRSGTVTAATQKALDAGTRPKARSTSGHIIEVDLSRDLLMFVTNGHVDYILNTSTGGGYVYYDQGTRNVAKTPKGHFKTYRVIDAPHRSSLGLLIRPRYFTGGYAIHGDGSVPSYPASHGCVRVSNSAIDWIWAKNLDPIGTTVWIY
ncbi:L,D-transpeptidase family protein [Rugosimonospora africana]|nr:L,D-transpeptidase family protein [Rugosimonospora africana]